MLKFLWQTVSSNTVWDQSLEDQLSVSSILKSEKLAHCSKVHPCEWTKEGKNTKYVLGEGSNYESECETAK